VQGIVNILVRERNLQEVWEESADDLKSLSAGPIPLNPTDLLDSRGFSMFPAGVREEFDYVVLDSPPIGLVSDAVILADQSDGVLLVLDAQNTRKVAVRQSLRSLKTVSADIIGAVANNIKTDKHAYYY
jgi:receptor protein-tyrosine kinase